MSEEAVANLEDLPVASQLLNLYDELTEVNDCCAFLCDAFASLAAEEDALDASTVKGFRHLSQGIKERMHYIKHRLKTIQKRAYEETRTRKEADS